MKKMALLATALAMVSGSALAADMRVKAVKAPPPPAFDPWDIAFGSAITNDYVFRGITQSNHKPSVSAYFEPRYNVTKDLQLYVGLPAQASPSRTAPRLKSTSTAVSARPSARSPSTSVFGATSIRAEPATTARALTDSAVNAAQRRMRAATALINGNVIKKNVSFFEVYAKVNYTVNDMFSVGANEYYSPNFLNTGAWGNYASITGKFTAPSSTVRHQRPRHVRLRRIRPPVAWNVGLVLRRSRGRSRTASTTPTTTPGTSASASPTRCSRWISATPTPTCRRVIATPSPAIHSPRQLQRVPALRHADQSDGRWLQLVRRDRHRQALG